MSKKFIKNGGFALLFSVLVSSLLLTIGLSIFSIALKELAISTASRQSIHAFFAADSGREYALYHDIKIGDLVFDEYFTPTQSTGIDTSTTTENFVIGNSGPNYVVTITKQRAEGNSTLNINTTILSQGYDTNDEDKVERAIEQTY
jgi:hypothetical protein